MGNQIIRLSESCEVEVLPVYPSGDVEVLAFPEDSRPGSPFGMILHAKHENGEWHGHLAKGGFGLTELFAISPRSIVAVVKGEGYYIPVYEADGWQAIPCTPILQAQLIPSLSLLVVASYTDLAAVGPEGVRWRTPRVSLDGITIKSASEELIVGIAKDVTDADVEFTVDPKTGEHQGEVEFPEAR